MAVYDYVMADGTTEKVSLSMAALFSLQRREPQLYSRYKQLYETISKGNIDELMIAELIYIAYRAANQEEGTMEMEEFIEKMSDSRQRAAETFGALFGDVEKKRDSGLPSGRRQGRGGRHR